MNLNQPRKMRTKDKRLFVQAADDQVKTAECIWLCISDSDPKCTEPCKHVFVSDRGPRLRTYVRAEREEKQPGRNPGG